MSEVALAAVGMAVGWLIAHIYYRRTSIEVPEWAKPLLRSFPFERPSRDELRELFQRALDSGDEKVDPLFGNVACPECHAPFDEVSTKAHDVGDGRTVIFADCPHCGWSAHAEA